LARGHKLPRKLLQNLEAGEAILGASKRVLPTEKPKWLIATQRRIIMFDEKIFGRYTLKSIPYEKIERITFFKGILASKITIKVEDGESIELKWMSKKDSVKLIEVVEEAIKNIAIEPPTLERNKGILREEITLIKPKEIVARTLQAPAQLQTPGGSTTRNPVRLLEMLRELYEAGILTEEEYEEKKRVVMEML
jgi:hypothetical protein